MRWYQNARAELKRKPGPAEARSTGSTLTGKQDCQSHSLPRTPPGLTAVDVGLVLLPCVGGNATEQQVVLQ